MVHPARPRLWLLRGPEIRSLLSLQWYAGFIRNLSAMSLQVYEIGRSNTLDTESRQIQLTLERAGMSVACAAGGSAGVAQWHSGRRPARSTFSSPTS